MKKYIKLIENYFDLFTICSFLYVIIVGNLNFRVLFKKIPERKWYYEQFLESSCNGRNSL